jgi:hypothetical protein
MSIPTIGKAQRGELASNLFHLLVAGLFGIVTLAAAAHVALSLA